MKRFSSAAVISGFVVSLSLLLSQTTLAAQISSTDILGSATSDTVGSLQIERGHSDVSNLHVEAVAFSGSRSAAARKVKYGEDDVIGITVDTRGKYVGVLRRKGGADPGARHDFQFLKADGQEIWSTQLCAGDERPAASMVHMADDGHLVVLVDAFPGQECLDGDNPNLGGYLAPETCVGLRVYSSAGAILFAEKAGQRVRLSRTGRFLSYMKGESADYWLVNLISLKEIKLPPVKKMSPIEVGDDGSVYYFNRGRPRIPGKQRVVFVPGKGLQSAE